MRVLAFFAAALLATLGTAPSSAQQARRAAPAARVAKPAPAPRWENVIVRTPQGGFRQGNPNAPVKLVEYGSRSCPTCGRFSVEGSEALRREWIATGQLSYEFRDYLIHGAPDLALALLNQCAPPQRFFTLLDQIFANQEVFAAPLDRMIQNSPKQLEAYQQLPPAQAATKFAELQGMIAFMKARGLPEARARQCLANPALIQGIARANAAAINQGINSTPSFFVNGRHVRAYTWDMLQPELRAAAG